MAKGKAAAVCEWRQEGSCSAKKRSSIFDFEKKGNAHVLAVHLQHVVSKPARVEGALHMRLHACIPFPSVTMFAPQHMLQRSGDSCNDHWAGNDHMRCMAAPAGCCNLLPSYSLACFEHHHRLANPLFRLDGGNDHTWCRAAPAACRRSRPNLDVLKRHSSHVEASRQD